MVDAVAAPQGHSRAVGPGDRLGRRQRGQGARPAAVRHAERPADRREHRPQAVEQRAVAREAERHVPERGGRVGRGERDGGARQLERPRDARVGVPCHVGVRAALGRADDGLVQHPEPRAAGVGHGAAVGVGLGRVDDAAELGAVDVDEAAVAQALHARRGQRPVALDALREVALGPRDDADVLEPTVRVDQVHAGSLLSSTSVTSKPKPPPHETGDDPAGTLAKTFAPSERTPREKALSDLPYSS